MTSISDMALEVRLRALEGRNSLERIKASKRKWPLEEVKAREDRMPALEAAADALEWLAANREKIPADTLRKIEGAGA